MRYSLAVEKVVTCTGRVGHILTDFGDFENQAEERRRGERQSRRGWSCRDDVCAQSQVGWQKLSLDGHMDAVVRYRLDVRDGANFQSSWLYA